MDQLDAFPLELDEALARERVHAIIDKLAEDAVEFINRSVGQRIRRSNERIERIFGHERG